MFSRSQLVSGSSKSTTPGHLEHNYKSIVNSNLVVVVLLDIREEDHVSLKPGSVSEEEREEHKQKQS